MGSPVPFDAAAGPAHLALLFLRCVNGAIFLVHGWEKATDLTAFSAGLQQLGIPLSRVLGPLAAFVELGGGLVLIAGILVRLAALGHAVIMVVAIVSVHTPWMYGLTGERGMQFPLALLASSLVMAASGGGPLAVGPLVRRLRSAMKSGVERYVYRAPRSAAGIVVLPLAGVLAGALAGPVPPPGTFGQPTATRASVIDAERALWKRFQERNIAGMLEMMDDEFTGFSGSMPRRLETRADEEDHVRTFLNVLSGQVLAYEMIDPRVRDLGEAAVLTYHFSVTVSLDGFRQTRTGKNTSVWVRRRGSWRQAHYHYTYNPQELESR